MVVVEKSWFAGDNATTSNSQRERRKSWPCHGAPAPGHPDPEVLTSGVITVGSAEVTSQSGQSRVYFIAILSELIQGVNQ